MSTITYGSRGLTATRVSDAFRDKKYGESLRQRDFAGKGWPIFRPNPPNVKYTLPPLPHRTREHPRAPLFPTTEWSTDHWSTRVRKLESFNCEKLGRSGAKFGVWPTFRPNLGSGG